MVSVTIIASKGFKTSDNVSLCFKKTKCTLYALTLLDVLIGPRFLYYLPFSCRKGELKNETNYVKDSINLLI